MDGCHSVESEDAEWWKDGATVGSRVVERRPGERLGFTLRGVERRFAGIDHRFMQPKTDPAAREAGDIVEVVRRLSTRFPDLPSATVQTAVDQAHQKFAGARIRDFVPVFVERSARDTLARINTDPPHRIATG